MPPIPTASGVFRGPVHPPAPGVTDPWRATTPARASTAVPCGGGYHPPEAFPPLGGRWMAEGQTDEGFHRSHAGVRPGGRACAAAGLSGRGPAFDGKSGGKTSRAGDFDFPRPAPTP